MDSAEKEEFLKRTEHAAKKMFEMQQSAMPPTPPFLKTAESFQKSDNFRQEEHAPPPSESKKHGGIFGKDILKFLDFKNFDLDSDRMLLLLLILILSGDNSDNTLLFALAYIML